MGSTTFSFKDPLRFGVATPGGALAAAELDEVSAVAGENPSMVLIYRDFLQSPPLAELSAVRARGAFPLVTSDVVALDGYNCGTSTAWSSSSAFALNAALLARRS